LSGLVEKISLCTGEACLLRNVADLTVGED
jgi:hypothetical protein